MSSPPADEFEDVGNWRITKLLGSGSYGKVKYAVHRATGQEAAVKIIEKPSMRVDQLERVQMEHTAMRELKHANIVQLFEVIEDEARIHIVMTYGCMGDLLEYIKSKRRLREEEALKIFRQLVFAVEHAHKNHYIHRDLKAENIFLGADLQVILGDWGFASRWNPGVMLSASYGSLHYAAPEICEGREYSGPEVDIWSLGVVLFAMVAGSLPFTGRDEWSIYQKLIAADFKVPSYVSIECRNLIKSILVPDRFRRATMFDIRRSPWFTRKVIAPAAADSVPPTTTTSTVTTTSTNVTQPLAEHLSPTPAPSSTAAPPAPSPIPSVASPAPSTPTPAPHAADARVPVATASATASTTATATATATTTITITTTSSSSAPTSSADSAAPGSAPVAAAAPSTPPRQTTKQTPTSVPAFNYPAGGVSSPQLMGASAPAASVLADRCAPSSAPASADHPDSPHGVDSDAGTGEGADGDDGDFGQFLDTHPDDLQAGGADPAPGTLNRKLSRFTVAGKKQFSITSLFGRLNPREKKKREEEERKRKEEEDKQQVRRPRSNSYSPQAAPGRARSASAAQTPSDPSTSAAASGPPTATGPAGRRGTGANPSDLAALAAAARGEIAAESRAGSSAAPKLRNPRLQRVLDD